MVLSWLWTGMVVFSLITGLFTGTASSLSAAAMEGAKSGVTLLLSMAGGLCLWSGLMKVMKKSGVTGFLQRLFRPLLGKIFPQSSRDSETMGYLCSNFTANLLGLGNAATPMGIAAVRCMKTLSPGHGASDEMVRLIVLNTASIQLIPTTVCAVRASLGASAPFDLLPAVWLTSLLSASLGLLAAWGMGKVWQDGG